MTFAAWVTIAIILSCLALLISTRLSADLILFGGLVVLILTQMVSPAEALVGFSNEGMLTVAALYVVAAGLRETGAIQFVINKLLGGVKSERGAQARIMAPVMGMSAFMNNTPVVASFIPALQDWAQKNHYAASKLMIPLSYGAIFGGACTIIGTSTNMVVNGLLIAEPSTDPVNIFAPAWVGVPVAVAGFVYMLTIGRKLLPDRHSGFETFQDPREYTIEMMVEPDSPLVDQSVEKAGLRNLPGVFLVEIYRKGQIIPAVSPDEPLMPDDRLIFAGVVDSIVDLRQINGLVPATDQVFKLDAPRRERRMVEAVVSPTNPIQGMSIRAGNFRNYYDAVVLAVARNGERVKKKVGDITLKTGDTLLLEAHEDFIRQNRNSRDWYLVSPITDWSPPDFDKAWIAWSVLAGMIVLAATSLLSIFEAALLAAGTMIVSGALDINDARKNIDLPVLLVIASALGLGNALQTTGAAETIAMEVMYLAGDNPMLSVAATYLVTWILTEMITNNAAAVLVFPIAISVAGSFGVSYLPFVMTIIVAASASFSTPIGYQTNLMIYGPGGYQFTDFMKVGLPLNLIVFALTVLLVPRIWAF